MDNLHDSNEPVAHIVIVGDMVSVSTGSNGLKELHKLGNGAPLYTTPPQPEQEPVAHSVVAGALFDFMGWLTSRKKRIVLSSADNASPAVEAITEFAKMRNLSLDDAKVQDWNTTPPQPEPVIDKSAAERIATALGWEPKRKPLSEERIDDIWNLHCDEMGYVSVSDAVELARDFEAAHGIKE